VRRRVAFALLLAACAWVFVRPSFSHRRTTFDPLDVRGREVARAIEERRFADARPIAADLESAHPDDPIIAFWQAEIAGGLGQRDEGDRWARVLALTQDADAACPAMPDAYEHAGEAQRALEAYAACAKAASDDPERWLDLARAYSSAGRTSDAERAMSRARALDPDHPLVTGGATPSVSPLNEELP
jgi:predicted Zn-dependent protease